MGHTQVHRVKHSLANVEQKKNIKIEYYQTNILQFVC